MSSLLLVLLMLILGSLTLQGISVQHQALMSQAAFEKGAIRDSANAESLLEWGRMLPWTQQPTEQCQTNARFNGRVCLRIFLDGTLLLIASSGEQIRWRTGKLIDMLIQFDRNGWSDFCPRKEAMQCQMP